MELLAPAGGMEQLRAAIAFGADAVYLAGPQFGMRARAANFELDDLAPAIATAHRSGVEAYVTCNIMIGEDDLKALPGFLERVDQAGADALILGDLGALALARRYAPGCRIHVSTQASVANSEAAKMWHSLGASRIVCAREMTLDDIGRMRSEVPDDLEIEAFVHGAQCMAVSGRCLISSYMAERSGNRGDCTQPCRWNYSLVEEKRPGELIDIEEDGRGTLIMNAMDLNMIDHLRELRDAGIDSIKIEGRNKKAFYVATVVNAYRQALDLLTDAPHRSHSTTSIESSSWGGSCNASRDAALMEIGQIRDELLNVSHRPYSEGFFFGAPKQAVDYDGYEQETLHIADVVDCRPQDRNGYTIVLRCRNRFAEGDDMEVLSPNQPIRKLPIGHIKHLGRLAASGSSRQSSGDADSESENAAIQIDGRDALGWVDIANRTSDLYGIACSFPIEPGSFIRSRIFRRSSRSNA